MDETPSWGDQMRNCWRHFLAAMSAMVHCRCKEFYNLCCCCGRGYHEELEEESSEEWYMKNRSQTTACETVAFAPFAWRYVVGVAMINDRLGECLLVNF
ncbi:hypothetical protein JTE90_022190 [Oedothorax gibbosus]|uniref:Uncharacterized protein n=1 Tax=Oedothorax gibbosus TaxID=931172 RepID=A0AAV6VQN5_9ARAC|nr:hypothetical protein JTE90_022190 [Oedothorax gibbosus]